jgi:hypothetical protein
MVRSAEGDVVEERDLTLEAGAGVRRRRLRSRDGERVGPHAAVVLDLAGLEVDRPVRLRGVLPGRVDDDAAHALDEREPGIAQLHQLVRVESARGRAAVVARGQRRIAARAKTRSSTDHLPTAGIMPQGISRLLPVVAEVSLRVDCANH